MDGGKKARRGKVGVGFWHNNIQPMSVEEAFYSLVYTPSRAEQRERQFRAMGFSLFLSPPTSLRCGRTRGPIVFHLQCVESNVWFCMLR